MGKLYFALSHIQQGHYNEVVLIDMLNFATCTSYCMLVKTGIRVAISEQGPDIIGEVLY